MNVARSLHTATLLNNGKVLVASGRHGGKPTPTAELFDPVSNTFTLTGSLNLGRKRFRASFLLDGTVLVTGGATLAIDQQPDDGTPTAELYNPTTGTFAYTPQNMHTGRTEHDATVFPDGTVLVTGGLNKPAPSDLYQPSTQSFSAVGQLVQDRIRHTAILLSNPAWGSLVGKAIIIGGSTLGNSIYGSLQQALDSVEIYDPATRLCSFFGTMTAPRQNHTAQLLNDGRILITGGVGRPFVSGTAELVTP